ncbi:MAG TPA: type VI secretion system baseplate subunit TssG [Polyangia bacterium]|jgi:type VI secretion system protein ImpH|nr:type VI secretion system baseplate subunit TssG [Polyangia bacterium]
MAGEIGSPPNPLGGPAAASGQAAATSGPSPPVARAPLPPERARSFAQILDLLARAPHQFDFFQVLRRMEALHRDRPDRPRFGAALRPADEPIRLGQEASLAFPPATLAALRAGKDGRPPRLAVNFFGLLGPNGPLPLHLTEYVRDRNNNAGDTTMGRFLDVFHHRMLMLFYRAWATGEPTVGQDLPETNRFFTYVGAMAGLGLASFRGMDAMPDTAKLFYAATLSNQTKHADGLGGMIGEFFQMPTRIQQFVGDWLELPLSHRWRLGVPGTVGLLGVSTPLGAYTFAAQHKFRVVLGPLDRDQFQRMLPGGASLKRLNAMVRSYTGDQLRWDLKLILHDRVDEPWHLGRSRLAWTSWAGRPGRSGNRREDLILDPQAEIPDAA